MRHYLFCMAAALMIVMSGCTGANNEEPSIAKFSTFVYQGHDNDFTQITDSVNQYINPVISGFHPDPSVCRKEDNYYLVCSSYSYFPGIPIYKSRNLVNWEQFGHVLDRPSQVKLDKSTGVESPSIAYNKGNDTFYLIAKNIGGIGSFIVKSRNPEQGWSDPLQLSGFTGDDASMFFDNNGKAYIVYNGQPDNAPEYEGHRAIRIIGYDLEKDSTIGESTMIVDGGSNKADRPVGIDSPNLYNVNGNYVLIASEGGRGTHNSEVAFKSKSPVGPFIAYGKNPVLTQRDRPSARITSVGHADIVQAPDNKWYAIFAGSRPYYRNFYNTGSEVCLMPVNWDDGYPVILEKGKQLPNVIAYDNCNFEGQTTGNFTWMDNFTDNELDNKWLFIRTPVDGWYKSGEGELAITPSSRSIYDATSPSFIGHKQQHCNFDATVNLDFNPTVRNEMAGLACYQNEKACFVFGKTIINKKTVIALMGSDTNLPLAYTEISKNSMDKKLSLRIEGQEREYKFLYSFDGGKNWCILNKEDSRVLSTETSGSLTGAVIGMYAFRPEK